MQIQAIHSFQPTKAANAVKFGHKHDHTCNGDSCSLPKQETPAAKKNEGLLTRAYNFVAGLVTGVINWVKTLFGGFFSDMKAVHDNVVKGAEPHTHDEHDGHTHDAGHKCCGGHDHDHDGDGGHVHGPNCKH